MWLHILLADLARIPANPLLETGYIRIPTQILKAIAEIGVNGREFKVIAFIAAKTLGFHKLKDWISHSQFEEGTGIAMKHISGLLNDVEGKGIITREFLGKKTIIGFNPALVANAHVANNEQPLESNPAYTDQNVAIPPNSGANRPNSGGYKRYLTKDKNIIIKEPCSKSKQRVVYHQQEPEKQKPEQQSKIPFHEVNNFVLDSIEKQFGREFVQANGTLIQSKLIDNEAYCRQNNYSPKPSMALQYVQTGIDNYLKSQYRTAKITAARDEKAGATTNHLNAITKAIQQKTSSLNYRTRTTLEALTDTSWANDISFDDIDYSI